MILLESNIERMLTMSKRDNGDGLIRKRKDGRYELRIMDGYQKNGKQKVVSFYGKTKEEGREKKKAYDEASAIKVETGIDIHSKYTFAEFADVWFERHQEQLEDVIDRFLSHEHKAILEIVTPPDVSGEILRQYMNRK